MGHVRAVYERMRADGRMCSGCLRMMDVSPFRAGPQTCEACLNAKTVVMRFRYEDGEWSVEFADPQSREPLGRSWRWEKADTIRSLVERSRTHLAGAPRIMFEKGLRDGSGELLLEVTGEQFLRLRN